jgi:nucleoside-diphosphate-sugar epimerase
MRPFLHILDAADAISASLNGDAGVYNVGSENMTILTLANRIKSKIPCEVEVVTEITDKRSYFVDSTKIMRTFAYVFRKTIEDTVEELKEKIFSKTE